MNVYIFTLIFLAWYFLALVLSETLGKKNRLGVEWTFFISFVFTPVIGLVACLLSRKKDSAQSA
jgi:hypothetical protein